MGSVITPEDVLESLMNDGTIDSLRLKIINQLKANEELKNTTIKMAEQSKVLNTPGAEKQTKRELFDALRQELELQKKIRHETREWFKAYLHGCTIAYTGTYKAPVLEKASKSVWELILDSNGLGKEISDTVEKVFCRLSGREPPLFPLPTGDTQPVKETENEKGKERVKGKGKGKGKGKEKEHENDKEGSNSRSKKRTFSDMREEGGADEVAKKSGDPPSAKENLQVNDIASLKIQ